MWLSFIALSAQYPLDMLIICVVSAVKWFVYMAAVIFITIF